MTIFRVLLAMTTLVLVRPTDVAQVHTQQNNDVRKLTSNIRQGSRRLEAAVKFSDIFDSTSCTCKSTPRPCIFIHGFGVKYEEPENVDSMPKYWGNITGHTPCCSSIQYAVLDTFNNTWYDPKQQQKVCDRALAVSDTSTKSTISDTIIVTHSMGGLMMAGAIANGRCSLANSTSWLSMGAPMAGSMGSDYSQNACADKINFVVKKFISDGSTGGCPVSTAMKSLAYEHESYSSSALNKAYKAAQEVYIVSVSGAICSTGYWGIMSKHQLKMWTMAISIPHKSRRNDGMVEFQSCRAGIPEDKFGDNYRDAFYASKANHYDLQFRAGDSLLNEKKMPVKWLECVL